MRLPAALSENLISFCTFPRGGDWSNRGPIRGVVGSCGRDTDERRLLGRTRGPSPRACGTGVRIRSASLPTSQSLFPACPCSVLAEARKQRPLLDRKKEHFPSAGTLRHKSQEQGPWLGHTCRRPEGFLSVPCTDSGTQPAVHPAHGNEVPRGVLARIRVPEGRTHARGQSGKGLYIY